MQRLPFLTTLLNLAPAARAAPSRRKHMRSQVSSDALDRPDYADAGTAQLPVAPGHRAPEAGPDEGSNEADLSTAAVLPLRHSSDLPLAMHAEWLPGHCGTTSEQGAQCRHSDSQGAAAGVRNLSACLAFCAGCQRCRFISYSEIGRDCSWYSACDTSRLEPSWLRHRTAQVRHVPRPRRCQASQLDSRGAWREGGGLFARGWRCPLWETSHARFNCSGHLPQRVHSVLGCGRPNAAASLLSGHRTLFFVGDSLSAQHARAVACRVLHDTTHALTPRARRRLASHVAPRSASLRTYLPRWAATAKLGNFLVPACTPECHEVSTGALDGAEVPLRSATMCHVPAGTRDRGCDEGVLPVVERLLTSRVVRWEDAIVMNEGLHHSLQDKAERAAELLRALSPLSGSALGRAVRLG